MNQKEKAPASVAAESEGQNHFQAHSECPWKNSQSIELLDARSLRRQAQVQHLHRCGPRCILEALIAVEARQPLDAVLADFERIPPEIYHAVGAAHFHNLPLIYCGGST